MSAISPTKNTGLIVDEFIRYATEHLKTVSGVASTVSLFPPAGTPNPGFVNWSGYFVPPSTPSAQTLDSNEINTEDPFIYATPISRIPVDSERAEQPIYERIYADELEVKTWDGGNTTDFKVNIFKANAWIAGPRNESFSKAIGSNYRGYSGRSQSASEVIRDIYIPVLNKVHADKSKGVRILMTAQTQREGFFPAGTHKWHPKASLSWITNNPGNVNTNGITIGKFATLEDGVAAQWNKVLGPVYTGQPKPSAFYKTSYTLYEYLSTYAPIMAKNAKGEWYKTDNDPTEYTNFVINYFKGQGYTITAQTTLAEINNIK
jgi:hypothetical protein